MRNIRALPILAIIILLVGVGSSIYVNSQKNDSTSITINNEECSVNQISQMVQEKSIEADTGFSLDQLVIETGVASPETHEYTIIGSDGYQKTVTWENMQNGIITKSRESVFAGLPKAYRIKEIIEIKVEQ
jgi:septum formation inhibitor MinC